MWRRERDEPTTWATHYRIGGQLDFVRGAALSEGGKPIIALPSTAAAGAASRIVSSPRPGAGVVTTRGHVHWVVTEYGAVNLFGLSLRQRAAALIGIAHPDVRETSGERSPKSVMSSSPRDEHA